MRTQIASRLTRLEQSAGTGARRIVVVERGHLEAAKAFLSTCPGVDMDRLVFVITGVRMGGDPKPEDWLRMARGESG